MKIACSLMVLSLLVLGIEERTQPSAQQHEGDLARGKRLFQSQCARCHGMLGEGGTGANLKRPMLTNAPDDQSLLQVIRSGIPGRGMPGTRFRSPTDIKQIAGYVRSLGQAAHEPLPGDPGVGRRIFERARCSKCHIIEGQGGSIGPELTSIGTSRGPTFLRQAIVHPGGERAKDRAGYETYLVVVALTKSGRLVQGVRINEDTFTLQLRDEENRFHSLRKHDLELLQKTDGSIMPSFETTLSPADIDHLVSYLASLGRRP